MRRKSLLVFLIVSIAAGEVRSQSVQIDPSFGNNGAVITDLAYSNDEGQDVLILPDGKIVVAGNRNNNEAGILARYLPDGTLDTLISNSILISGGNWKALAMYPDGEMVAMGETDGDLILGR